MLIHHHQAACTLHMSPSTAKTSNARVYLIKLQIPPLPVLTRLLRSIQTPNPTQNLLFPLKHLQC